MDKKVVSENEKSAHSFTFHGISHHENYFWLLCKGQYRFSIGKMVFERCFWIRYCSTFFVGLLIKILYKHIDVPSSRTVLLQVLVSIETLPIIAKEKKQLQIPHVRIGMGLYQMMKKKEKFVVFTCLLWFKWRWVIQKAEPFQGTTYTFGGNEIWYSCCSKRWKLHVELLCTIKWFY